MKVPEISTKDHVWTSRTRFQFLLTVILASSKFLPSQSLVLIPEILFNKSGNKVCQCYKLGSHFSNNILKLEWHREQPLNRDHWKTHEKSTYATISSVLWHSGLTIDDDNAVCISKKLEKRNGKELVFQENQQNK